jgi:hypothetical protein
MLRRVIFLLTLRAQAEVTAASEEVQGSRDPVRIGPQPFAETATRFGVAHP